MKKTQYSQIEMFNTVLQYLEENRPLWEGNKGIGDLVAEIQSRTRSLLDKMGRQLAPTNGATNQRLSVRLELEVSILQMATHLAVLALRTEDEELAAQCDVSPSILGDSSREALGGTGERIHRLLNEHLGALAAVGITEVEVKAFQSLVKKYHEAKNAPRRAITKRAGETTTLPTFIRVISSLLRHLDRLMTQFRTSQPEFLAGYVSARVLVQPRANGSKAKQTPANAATAAKAEVKTESKA